MSKILLLKNCQQQKWLHLCQWAWRQILVTSKKSLAWMMKLTSTMEISIHNMPCRTNSVHVSLGTSTVSKLDMTGTHTTKPIMITITLHRKSCRDTSSTSFILILSTVLKHRNTSWRELIRTNSVYCVSVLGRHMKMLPSKSLIGSGIKVGRGDFGVHSKGG